MNAPSPVVAAHELGGRLRERREALGLPAAEVALAAGCSPQFLSQVENGKKVPAVEKLRLMAERLEFTEEVDDLLDLRAEAVKRGPFAAYSGIFSTELLRFYGFEYGSESVHSYCAGIVHGLLQTAEYAEALFRSTGPLIRQAEVERLVEARLVRQRRLDGARPIAMSIVTSEAAIRQQIGGPPVLATQLKFLLERIDTLGPRLDVRVIPFTNPGHPAVGMPNFSIFGFASTRLPDLVWVDQVSGVALVDDAPAVHEHRLAYSAARAAALSAVDSVNLIQNVLQELA